MATPRFRLQFKFWLDMNKSDECELAETIAELKENKAFSRVVRDGIRLMMDLWRGDLAVLLALFPWVEEAFYERFREQQPAADYTLHQQLERLERLLLEQGNSAISDVRTPLPVRQNGPKPLAVPMVPGPIHEEDEEMSLVVRKAATDGASSQNFLNSAFALVN